MLRKLALAVVLASSLFAQSLPLESLVLEGTTMSRDTVLSTAGLRIGGPIDKAAIEAACGKLTDTGLIQSISYRYAPGPKRGWVLTLTIEDQKQFTAASIDFPGVDDTELWRWLAARYPAFDHKVPANDPAQEFIAKALAEHAKAELDGQAVVTRMESDLATGRSLISFQPANLPRIAAMNFTGQHELSADALTVVLAKLVADDGYTGRHFRQLVEINLRLAYEEHGMYRVKFPKITAEKAGAGRVTVTTAIEEGAQFKLGEVSFVGDNLPVEAMLKAAKFKKGQVANWTEIQSGIWAAERPVKRTGYFAAASRSERILRDDQSVLDLKISFTMGPLFHAGQLKIIGLTPELEAKARKLWKAQRGDPYDFEYAGEFLKEFGQSVSLGQFKKVTPSTQRQPDNVMDWTLLFESR
jgi:outer membrane protein assembly factor BamA